MFPHAPPTLLLLPGLGADGRLYDPQRAGLLDAGVRLFTPDYDPPRPGESFGDYALRYGRHLSMTLDLRPPLYVGGLSFGGVVAVEAVARHAFDPIAPAAVLMVSGCMSGRQVAPAFRAIERAAQRIPVPWAGRLMDGPVPWGLSAFERLDGRASRLLGAIAAASDVPTLKWQGREMTRWPGPPPLPAGVVVRSIHGDADGVIPLGGVLGDGRCGIEHVVPGGRHLLNLTHPEVVTAFWLRGVGAGLPPSPSGRGTGGTPPG